MNRFISFCALYCVLSIASVANAALLSGEVNPAGLNSWTDLDAEYVVRNGSALTNADYTNPNFALQNGDTIVDVLVFPATAFPDPNAIPPGYQLTGVATFTVGGITPNPLTGYSDMKLTGNVTLYESVNPPATTVSVQTLNASQLVSNTVGAEQGTQLLTLSGTVSSTGVQGSLYGTQVPYTAAALQTLSGSGPSTSAGFLGNLTVTSNPGGVSYINPGMGVTVNTSSWFDSYKNGVANGGNVLLASNTTVSFVTPEPSSSLICLGLAGVAGVGRLRRRWAARS